MRRLAVILAAMALITAVPIGAVAANPDIGGDAVHEEEVYFSAGSWGMTVYSYVFDNTSAPLPGVLELDPGEMLFMYLLDVPYTSGTSIEHYSVGNPDLMVINTVGFENAVVPDGYNILNFEDPYIYGYSGPAEATVFTYFGDFMDPWCTLDPGEYSLVWYIAESSAYGPLNATADSQGQGDTQLVPGPVCIVDFHHFGGFAAHWLDGDCNDLNKWCDGADLDYSGDVNLVDLDLFVDEWLDYCPNNWPLR